MRDTFSLYVVYSYKVRPPRIPKLSYNMVNSMVYGKENKLSFHGVNLNQRSITGGAHLVILLILSQNTRWQENSK